MFLILAVITITGCASLGPTLIIETEEPAEDFVVVCSWSTGIGLAHGGGSVIDEDVHVIKSGEKLSCGVNPFGRGSATSMHPIYTGGEGSTSEMVDGVLIIKPITKLQRLDELKAKFEAGYWGGDEAWAGLKYARQSSGICGFDKQYLEKYSQVKVIDVEHFKSLYNDSILKCYQRGIALLNKYSPRSHMGTRSSAENRLEMLWRSKDWNKYDKDK